MLTRAHRNVTALAIMAVLILAAVASGGLSPIGAGAVTCVAGTSVSSGTVTVTFCPSGGGDQAWTAPAGVGPITFTAYGGQGGSGGPSAGTAGQTGGIASVRVNSPTGVLASYNIHPGSAGGAGGAAGSDCSSPGPGGAGGSGGASGGNGGNGMCSGSTVGSGGGGGGAASMVLYFSDSDIVVVAGGGGGASDNTRTTSGGNTGFSNGTAGANGCTTATDCVDGSGGGGGGVYGGLGGGEPASDQQASQFGQSGGNTHSGSFDALSSVSPGSVSGNQGDGFVTASYAQIATTTTLTGSYGASVDPFADGIDISGGNVTVTYTATVKAGSASVPEGAVDFTDDGTSVGCDSVAVSAGVATCTVTYGSGQVGIHTIVAAYSDAAAIYKSSSDSHATSVGTPPTYPTDTHTINATVGVPIVTYTSPAATCSPACTAFGSSTPAISGLSVTNNSGGTITVSGTPAPGSAGTHTWTTNATNGVSPEATFTLTINVGKASTTTSLTPLSGTPVYGQPVTFIATVTPSDTGTTLTAIDVDDGTVDFKDGTTILCSGEPVADGISICSLAPDVLANFHAGTHSITAEYSGGGDFNGSTSSALNQVVDPASTTVSFNLSPNPSVYGQPFTITATVAANAPSTIDPANGTVSFFVDGQPTTCNGGWTGEDLQSAGEVITCNINYLFVLADIHTGTHTIKVEYTAATTPNADYNDSSTQHNQVVTEAATTTVLTSSINPSVYGQPVTFTATVTVNSPSVLNPFDRGQVTFGIPIVVNGSVIVTQHTVPLVSSTASYVLSNSDGLAGFTVGSHLITAAYTDADAPVDYLDSSDSITQVVTPAATTTTASAQYFDSAPVPTVAITATVVSNSPSIIGPGDDGTVSFFSGPTLLCTVQLSNGQAVCEAPITPSSGPGHNLTAVYNGTANFLSSSATTDAVPYYAGPVITSVTTVFPNTGQAWLVQGAGFSGASSVTVCGISVPFTVVSDTVMLIGVPVVNAPQQCTIIVIATGGTASTNGTVTVVPQPQPGAPVVIYPSGPGTPAIPTCGPTDSITLSGLWTLVAWSGQDGMSVKDALAGGTDGCGTNITAQIAVVWGFDAATQTYHAYFPSAANVPGANDLTDLTQGLGYWFALVDPTSTVVFKVERGT